MKSFIPIITALVASTTATPVIPIDINRRQAPDPNSVYIEKVSWVGSGCPPGSASADIIESGTLVSIGFSKYIAGTGKGQSSTDARKNCDVRITLHYPQGWSWTVATTDFRGYASIPSGCSATLGAQYWFSGSQDTASSMLPITGPKDANYRLTSSIGHDALVWSPCGVTGPLFNVNSQAVVKCDKDAYLGVDAQDSKFKMELHLQWQNCTR